jgi:23S rRNA G2069 N7-methylase RlmK/C1962 C5-methylase RlmI
LCTGIGQSAYSYAKAGFHVKSIENDRMTYEIAIHNAKQSGLASQIECILGDAPAALSEAVETKAGYAVVHLDPPWSGNYDYDLSKPFRLEHISLNIPSLVKEALKVACLTVMNAPHNVDVMEIQGLTRELGCRAIVQYQYIEEFPPCFGQAPVYFFRTHTGGSSLTDECRKAVAHLTVDGRLIGSEPSYLGG